MLSLFWIRYGITCVLITFTLSAFAWEPVPGRIMTPWAEVLTPENAWAEYPRPLMVREEWQSLNGLWDYAIVGEEREWGAGRVENAVHNLLLNSLPEVPTSWDRQILVPFAPESALSGVGKIVRPDQLLWYRRSFTVPTGWAGRRILLHFEAVDWQSIVLVNGTRVGENQGGYVPFSLDITDALVGDGPQEVVLVAWDPSNMGDQSIGKQSLPEARQGFRYTPTSGIWQSVWMEPVPEAAIASLRIVPDFDAARVSVAAVVHGAAEADTLRVRVLDGGRIVAEGNGPVGQALALEIAAAKSWSPDAPHLYDLEVSLSRGARSLDRVASYFGLRKIHIAPDAEGVQRIFLNNAPIFQFGPLDQGYWPDGVLTPPSDEAAKFDVQYLKDIGCNMVRVHIKVHPARWYAHCDRLGLLVWQDFVCTRKFEQQITPASAAQWELEQQRMIDHLHNHPAIVKWIVFNEGWGQYDTERLTRWTQRYDPTRLASAASGWTDFPVGDIYDIHDYSYHISPAVTGDVPDRAVVCGECGGFNVPIEGHLWHKDQTQETRISLTAEQGRESYPDAEVWESRYAPWIDELWLLKAEGMNAAVYTQISDVEHELNGWLTYDRKVSKIPKARLRELHERLYAEVPTLQVLASSKDAAALVRSADLQRAAWSRPGFDDDAWESFPTSSSLEAEQFLFLRKTFSVEQLPKRLVVRYAGFGEIEVHLNGTQVQTIVNTDRAGYLPVSMVILQPEASDQLRLGENLLAVRKKPVPRNLRSAVQPGRPLLEELALLAWPGE